MVNISAATVAAISLSVASTLATPIAWGLKPREDMELVSRGPGRGCLAGLACYITKGYVQPPDADKSSPSDASKSPPSDTSRSSSDAAKSPPPSYLLPPPQPVKFSPPPRQAFHRIPPPPGDVLRPPPKNAQPPPSKDVLPLPPKDAQPPPSRKGVPLPLPPSLESKHDPDAGEALYKLRATRAARFGPVKARLEGNGPINYYGSSKTTLGRLPEDARSDYRADARAERRNKRSGKVTPLPSDQTT